MTITKPQQLLLRDLFVGSVTGTYLRGAKSNIAFNLAKLGLVEVIRPFLVVGGHFVITTAGRAVVKPQETVDPPLAERAPRVDKGLRDLTQATFEYEFLHLLKRARRDGYALVVDADAQAVRFMTTAEAASGADLRQLGRAIRVDNACGGGGPKDGGGGGGTP